MFFERRPIRISDAEALPQLGHDLSGAGVTHTLCTAFRLASGVVIVNDATSEDGAGEWAVLVPDGDHYLHVDSITFGWMEPGKAFATLFRLAMDGADGHDGEIVHLHPHPERTCHLCA